MTGGTTEIVENPETSTPASRLLQDSAGWRQWLSHVLTAGMLLAVVWNLGVVGIDRSWQTIDANPAFWLVFAGWYLALPISEWVIYSRLWHLPAAGFVELLRKLVSNELLLGYSGEVSFYNWARGHGEITAAPFGAIKDVSILSALAGNLVTLAALVLSWIFAGQLFAGAQAAMPHTGVLISAAGAVVTISLLAIFYRKKVFSLSSGVLRWIFGIHLVRLAVMTGLSALLWRLALPNLPLISLLAVAAMQLLVMRMPFVSNKELLFANLAIVVLGKDNQLAIVLAMIATLTMLVHMALGIALGLSSLVAGRRAAAAEAAE